MDAYQAQVIKATFDDKRTREVRDLLRTYRFSRWHLYTTRLRTTRQPYHNHQHCYKVALNSVDGARAQGLGLAETRLLFLAGLYHDHAHTADSKISDQVNVARAIRGARLWLRIFHRGISMADRAQVLRLIEVTENSHSLPLRHPWEGIIRDADLLGTVGDVDGDLWRAALGCETGQAVTVQNTKGFLASRHWTTAWGRSEADKFIKEQP